MHVNRLQRRIQPSPGTLSTDNTTNWQSPLNTTNWQPPLVHHDIISEDPAPEPRYPTRTRRPPDRLQL